MAQQRRLGTVARPKSSRAWCRLVGAGGGLSEQATDRVQRGGGEGVAVAIDADDAVDGSARMGMRLLLRWAAGSVSAWEGLRTSCRSGLPRQRMATQNDAVGRVPQ